MSEIFSNKSEKFIFIIFFIFSCLIFSSPLSLSSFPLFWIRFPLDKTRTIERRKSEEKLAEDLCTACGWKIIYFYCARKFFLSHIFRATGKVVHIFYFLLFIPFLVSFSLCYTCFQYFGRKKRNKPSDNFLNKFDFINFYFNYKITLHITCSLWEPFFL